MEPQAFKVVTTHTNKIFVCTILSITISDRYSHLGGMNVDVQPDLATLEFKQRENVEGFHERILRLKQEISLSGEPVSPTRILLIT